MAQIAQRIHDAICQIGGGRCDDEQRAADEPCVTSTSRRDANLNVQVVAVDIERGGSYLREDRCEGSQRTTVFIIFGQRKPEAIPRAVTISARGSGGFRLDVTVLNKGS